MYLCLFAKLTYNYSYKKNRRMYNCADKHDYIAPRKEAQIKN